MSRISVPSNTWVEVFDSTTSGSFKLYNFSGRLKRSSALPSDIGGVTVKGGEGVYSELISIASDDTNNLYVYNPSSKVGYVEKDL